MVLETSVRDVEIDVRLVLRAVWRSERVVLKSEDACDRSALI